jgi:uncharacterized damage-inducible protein DinB
MAYITLNDFFSDWAYESGATQKYINNLTNESLNQKITPDGRSLGFLAWHLVETISEMPGRTGLKIFSPDFDHYDRNNAEHLKECFKNASDSLVEKIKAGWNDDTLKQEDDMYGETWNRGYTLACLILHQCHHRGQMSVLMRQAGLKVPGVYGPSKEEWVAYGMEPHP